MPGSVSHLPPRQRRFWRILQVLVFLVGVGIVVALFLWPQVGLTALWNVLIPVAPALLVVAPGVWRNVCPLGSTALISRHMGVSARRRLSPRMQGWLALTGLVLLLLIVPLRHVVLNHEGVVTGSVLVAVGVLAIAMGLMFEWKSGWCSGLCPVHPVEKFYGQRPGLTVRSAHCTECERCSVVCPDSTLRMNPLVSPRTPGHRIAGIVLVGGFPGYVWGWFRVSDYVGRDASGLLAAYGLPLGGLAVSLAVYVALRWALDPRHRDLLIRGFAAAAVGFYYWFRLPMLLGFGEFPHEGMLVDLRGVLSAPAMLAIQVGALGFFAWWLVFRRIRPRSWAVRPPFARGQHGVPQPVSLRVSAGN